TVPTTSSASDAASTREDPNRCAMRLTNGDVAANATSGNVLSAPLPLEVSPMSCSMYGGSVPTPVSAGRRLIATRTIAMTKPTPRRAGRPAGSCACASLMSPRRPPSLAQVLEPLRLVGRDARVDDGLEGAVHHLVEVVRLEPRAVVGDAVLGEVVRADPLGAVHAADLALARVGGLRRELLLLLREQAGAQHAHGGLAVLQLRLLVLHRHDDAGRQVRDAHGRVGRVDRLPARARRAVHVDLEVVRVDLQLFRLVDLGEDEHARR